LVATAIATMVLPKPGAPIKVSAWPCATKVGSR